MIPVSNVMVWSIDRMILQVMISNFLMGLLKRVEAEEARNQGDSWMAAEGTSWRSNPWPHATNLIDIYLLTPVCLLHSKNWTAS